MHICLPARPKRIAFVTGRLVMHQTLAQVRWWTDQRHMLAIFRIMIRKVHRELATLHQSWLLFFQLAQLLHLHAIRSTA